MGRFYGIKIKDGVINGSTGLPWTLADVPKKWKQATQFWLSENT